MPNTARRAQRRDDNDKPLRNYLKREWIFPKPHIIILEAGQGADWLLLSRGRLDIVEIKDPNKPPSDRTLTPDEQSLKEVCESLGIPYHLVMTEQDVDALMENTGTLRRLGVK